MKKLNINNVKTSKWKLSLITFLLKSFSYTVNLFIKKKYTHLFFYSEQQDKIGLNVYPYEKHITYVNGIEYSEMREIGKGFSNWDDAKIVGIGSYKDITYNN
jgi:hypothetical protein